MAINMVCQGSSEVSRRTREDNSFWGVVGDKIGTAEIISNLDFGEV